jgi:hypothetical protein
MTGTETRAVNELSGLRRFVAEPRAMTHCSVSWPRCWFCIDEVTPRSSLAASH